jgi:hypothetical protein
MPWVHSEVISDADVYIPGVFLCNGRLICDADAHTAHLVEPWVAGGMKIADIRKIFTGWSSIHTDADAMLAAATW